MQRTPSHEPQRIAKLLARAGVASRREIERMIAEGRVALNGTTLETPATVLTSLHGVTVDGEPVQAAAPARLFLFHKPTGLLTAASDPRGRPTIYDRLPRDLPRLMPVGRLDLNTEGLLLMTTDGEFKRELELPATGVERTYRARTYGAVTQAQLEELMEGVEIEGVRYGSIDANLERRTGANVWIELTLREGKNREVRRVLEHLGLEVSRLIRTRYGPFVLGDLPPGEIGEVRQHDLVAFRKTLSTPAARRTAIADVTAAPTARAPRAAAGRPTRPTPGNQGRPGREGAAKPERPARAGARPLGRTPQIADERARPARAPAPRKREVREEIDTRPERLRTRPVAPGDTPRARPPRPDAKPAAPAPEAARPARPKRGAGWAKAKPKPGSKPRSGPRTPR